MSFVQLWMFYLDIMTIFKINMKPPVSETTVINIQSDFSYKQNTLFTVIIVQSELLL